MQRVASRRVVCVHKHTHTVLQRHHRRLLVDAQLVRDLALGVAAYRLGRGDASQELAQRAAACV
jgi:hypothetical protein